MSHKYGPAMLVVIASELDELCFYNPTRIPQRLPCFDLVRHSNVYEHLYILSLIAGKIVIPQQRNKINKIGISWCIRMGRFNPVDFLLACQILY